MNPLQIVIGVAVLGWILYNQLRVRQFSTRRLRLAGILGVVGLIEVLSTASSHPASMVGWTLLIAGLVIGAALGLLRAATVKLWVRDGVVYTQGHLLTAALWLVGIGAHIGLDLLAPSLAPSAEGINSSSVLLFLAVSLGVQGLMTVHRVRSLPGAPVMDSVFS
jgi:NAD/NADP transhydrogenase beta subunit